MHARLERLSERTDGFTVTPAQYALVAYVALGALTLIVLAASALAWRARPDAAALRSAPNGRVAGSPWRAGASLSASARGDDAGSEDRGVVLAVRTLAALGALTIFAGTTATAAGPHAG